MVLGSPYPNLWRLKSHSCTKLVYYIILYNIILYYITLYYTVANLHNHQAAEDWGAHQRLKRAFSASRNAGDW